MTFRPSIADTPHSLIRPRQRWLPVRQLSERHRAQVLAHLLALDADGRQRRFGHPASDDRIAHYAQQMDFGHDAVFGVFDRQLRLLAMAHLALMPQEAMAEFGVSVLAAWRGRGLGGQLFSQAVTHARHRGVSVLHIQLARDNVAMLALVRRAGASIRFEGSDVLAQLPLRPRTLVSRLGEYFNRQAADLDYRLKRHTRRPASGHVSPLPATQTGAAAKADDPEGPR